LFQPLDDNKTLGDCGFTSATARAQAPATIGLAFRLDGKFFIINKEFTSFNLALISK
jgi:hypothetical protein